MRAVRNHCDNDRALLSNFFAAACSCCTAAYKVIYRSLVEVKDDQLVTGLHQVLSHRSTHNAESYKTNFHFSFLLDVLICILNSLSSTVVINIKRL